MPSNDGRTRYAADGTTIIGYSGLNNTVGTLYSNNANCFLITIKKPGATDLDPDVVVDLREEDDAANEAVEMIVMETNPLAFFVTPTAAGTIMGVFDISISSAGLQSQIRNMGTAVGVSTGTPSGIDVSKTTVTAASAISFT